MVIHSSIRAWRIPWTEEPGAGGWATVHGITKSGILLRDSAQHSTVILYGNISYSVLCTK